MSYLDSVFNQHVKDAESLPARVVREAKITTTAIGRLFEAKHHGHLKHFAVTLAEAAKARISGSTMEGTWQSTRSRLFSEALSAQSKSRQVGGFAHATTYQEQWNVWNEPRHTFLWTAGAYSDVIASMPRFQQLIAEGITEISFSAIKCVGGTIERQTMHDRMTTQQLKDVPSVKKIEEAIQAYRRAREPRPASSGYMSPQGKYTPFHDVPATPQQAEGGFTDTGFTRG